MDGVERIAAERSRQKQNAAHCDECDGTGEDCNGNECDGCDGSGKVAWSAGHDDGHTNGELAWAAVCYASPGEVLVRGRDGWGALVLGDPWPWDARWDSRPKTDYGRPMLGSPEQRIRSLEKAGALIAAEIDRLLRLEPI